MDKSLVTVAGGRSIPVTFIDGTKATEDVFVRQLPVRLFPAYQMAVDDEAKTVELFCAKPHGWADTLAPESHNAIMEAGEEINLGFFGPWCQRQVRRQKALMPEQYAAMEAKILAMASQRLTALSPASPPPPASAS